MKRKTTNIEKKFNISKSWILLIGIVLLTVLLNALAWNSTVFSDIYIEKIFPLWVNTYGRLTGLFPFSVGEWLLITGVILIVLSLIFGICFIISFSFHFIYRHTRKSAVKSEKPGNIYGKWCSFLRCFYNFMLWVIVVVSLVMTLNCFILYQGTPFSQKYFSQQTSSSDLKQLIAVRNDIVKKCNDLSKEVNRLENGSIVYQGEVSLSNAAIKNMQALGKKYPQLVGYYPNPKPLLFSDLMCQQYMQGYYFPFSMEANYNNVMYIMNIPATMCHELAHLRGYILEDEANFISYIACTESEDKYFQYSGYLSVLYYFEEDIYDAYKGNTEHFYETIRQIPLLEILPQVKQDNIFVTEENWDRIHKNSWFQTETVEKAADIFVDTTLKINGVADGIKSYNRVVELILQYNTE